MNTCDDHTSVDIGTVLLGFYDCVTDPAKFRDLSEMIVSWLDQPDAELYVPVFERHSDKAWEMLARFASFETSRPESASVWDTRLFSSEAELKTYAERMLSAEDHIRLGVWLKLTPSERQDQSLLLRLFQDTEETPDLAFLTCDVFGGLNLRQQAKAFAGTVSDFLAGQFELTHSETRLVESLLTGGTLVQIAARLGKSVETIRTQMKSVTGKLGAASQSDVLRMASQAANHLVGSDADNEKIRVHSTTGVRTLERPDGRTITYEIDGTDQPRTLLFVHGSAEGRHWPKDAIDVATGLGWRVVRMSRAANGASTVNAKLGTELLAAHIEDYAAVLSAEGIGFVSIFAQEDGLSIAFRFAAEYPEIARDIVTYDPMPPILRRSDTAGFRSIAKGLALVSLLSPKLLKSMVRGSMRALSRRLERGDFENPVNGVSEVDQSGLDAYHAQLRNDSDLVATQGEGVWRDASYMTIDWATIPDGSNTAPRCQIICFGDSPFATEGACEKLGLRLNAPVHFLPSRFPEVSSPLKKALELLH